MRAVRIERGIPVWFATARAGGAHGDSSGGPPKRGRLSDPCIGRPEWSVGA
jgi:hypothetical protein